MSNTKHTVAAFYRFTRLDDIQNWRPRLQDRCIQLGLRGSILLAPEGINGTISGPDAAVRDLLGELRQHPGLGQLEARFSWAPEPINYRMKVKLKREIVSFDMPGFDPVSGTGTYVSADEWNDLIRDPDVVCIDTRNDYEVEAGTFAGAINPATRSFKEFTEFVERELSDKQDRPIAMFCTGGIRCEKATAWMKDQGFANVYHLQGGILKYLESVPPDQSLWQGECFVFDNRVTVNHDLHPGTFGLCRACRQPLSPDDIEHPDYEYGVSCRKCAGTHSPEQIEAFRERTRQVLLAEQRGECHFRQQGR